MDLDLVYSASKASKVFSIKKKIALPQHDVSSISKFILFPNVNHIKVFLIEESELFSASIEVSESADWYEWPKHKLFYHYLSCDTSHKSGSKTISCWLNIAVINVFSAHAIGPVSFNRCPIFVWLSIKNFLLYEVHSKDNGGLVLLGDSTVILVKVIKVILVADLQLLSQKNRHLSFKIY